MAGALIQLFSSFVNAGAARCARADLGADPVVFYNRLSG